MIDGALERSVRQYLSDARTPADYDRPGLRSALLLQYLVPVETVLEQARTPDLEAIVAAVREEGHRTFTRKVEYLVEFGRSINVPDVDSQVLSQVMLSVLDEKWKDHLYDLDQLRNAIQYRAYGQRDPLVEYKREAFEMFEDLIRDIQGSFTERYLKIQVSAEPPRPAPPRRPPPPPPPSRAGPDDLFSEAPGKIPTPQPVSPTAGGGASPRAPRDVGRNDPCPCGSGRKYKKCHGAGR